MNQIPMQNLTPVLTLISLIVGIIASFLALVKSVRDNGFFQSIGVFLLLTLPVIFLKFVIMLINNSISMYLAFLVFFELVQFICICIERGMTIKEIQGTIFYRGYYTYWIVFLTPLALLIFSLINLNPNVGNITSYMQFISKHKIGLTSYLYMAKHLKITLYVFIKGLGCIFSYWCLLNAFRDIWASDKIPKHYSPELNAFFAVLIVSLWGANLSAPLLNKLFGCF